MTPSNIFELMGSFIQWIGASILIATFLYMRFKAREDQ
jgi:hypothetical protein